MYFVSASWKEVCLCLFLLLFVPAFVCAQSANPVSKIEDNSNSQSQSSDDHTPPPGIPGAAPQLPKPGELGSPFSVEHFWNRLGFEIGAGYVSMPSKGTGYFNNGYNVTTGLVDHLTPHWNALAEVELFGMSGSLSSNTASYSNTDFSISLGTSFVVLPRHTFSPYLIGSAGYYIIGSTSSSSGGTSVLTAVDSANSSGFSAGAGLRRRLYSDSRMELYAEGRYHYLFSGSTSFGQLSLFPVTAGLRW
jgi:hypothetical protein